ncbi:hypothetical protein A4H97_17270 [Niastella yeongjuensis]|uniref:RHS repeat-associated core domain-containing protein n=1 Tax=Niastella yeongjuensis TaxID=354355 RepID=A0A1V9E1G3_9BACT|nr:RHS repeat-associated core domain-containing protein [Niastella yeongjuensis]OQP39967.1 hypothetical protein A4H97_17270 [Niastella yeongjuensis]SEO11922.1 RHS repeat-associated core domain-containing protein [Niastella yeongjuensis]
MKCISTWNTSHFGETFVEEHSNTNRTPYLFNGKELDEETGLYYYGAGYYDPRTSIWQSVDPLSHKFPGWSPYSFAFDDPIRFADPTGAAPEDFVKDNKTGQIHWDKDAKSQATTKAGETYLGKDLTFKFNSYIDAKLWDGPLGSFPAGDKLTSTITVTSNTDANNNLLSVDIKSSVDVHKTGGIIQGDGYFPGQKNVALNIKGAKSGFATFEQHAKVNGFEETGLLMMGFEKVNVAQKLTIGLNGTNLSVTAATDIFPSATLSVNNVQLFQYNQPSFKATHGRELTGYREPISKANDGLIPVYRWLRPAPAFYQRYK